MNPERILLTQAKNLKVKLALNKHLRTYKFCSEYLDVDLKEGEQGKLITNLNKEVDELIIRKRQQNVNLEQKRPIPVVESKSGESKTNIFEPPLFEIQTLDTPAKPTQDSIFKEKLPGQKVTLATFEEYGADQITTARKIFDNIHYHKKRGQLLIAQAGGGKTYVFGSVVANLIHNGFLDDCFSPWPVIVFSKVSIIAQTKDVLENGFGLDIHSTVHVINIEALRASLVGTLIEEEPTVLNGEPDYKYFWRPSCKPKLIVWDESQGLAREDSLQSKIANAMYENGEDSKWDTYEILCSATPGARLCEMKHFSLSTRKEVFV